MSIEYWVLNIKSFVFRTNTTITTQGYEFITTLDNTLGEGQEIMSAEKEVLMVGTDSDKDECDSEQELDTEDPEIVVHVEPELVEIEEPEVVGTDELELVDTEEPEFVDQGDIISKKWDLADIDEWNGS